MDLAARAQVMSATCPASGRFMQLQLEFQRNPVADEVSAITAVVRPILRGVLYALKAEVVDDAGGHPNVRLRTLPRLHRAGDGDCGICFEYAVHDALVRGEPTVVERVEDALVSRCRVRGNETASILFGLEKRGALTLIETARDALTSESRLLAGTRGQPAKLLNHIDSIAAAFRRPAARDALPWSISGLWKADLFVGHTDSDQWVGTSVKINLDHLEGGRGLRIGIVPARQGATDAIRLDDRRNLVICPLPYDGAFMEIFYRGWNVVQQFIAADAELPREVNLPFGPERQVARELVTRRDFPVLDVIDALLPQAQPELLETRGQQVEVVGRRDTLLDLGTESVIAPMARSAAD